MLTFTFDEPTPTKGASFGFDVEPYAGEDENVLRLEIERGAASMVVEFDGSGSLALALGVEQQDGGDER